MNQSYNMPDNLTRITKIILLPTNEQNAPIVRSLEMNITYSDLNNIQETIASVNKIDNVNLAKTCPTMYKLSKSGLYVPDIPYGWNQRRYRFLIVVETTRPDSVFRSYIQGFTDYEDDSIKGTPDPNMTFYPNNVVNIIQYNNSPVPHPHSKFQMLFDPNDNYDPTIGVNDSTRVLSRPYDLYHYLSVSSSPSNPHEGMPYMGSSIYDSKSSKESRIENKIPVSHITKIIDSVQTGIANTFGSHRQKEDSLTAARSETMEVSSKAVPFIQLLSNIQMVNYVTKFTLNDLMLLDPSINTRQDVLNIHNDSDKMTNSVNMPMGSLTLLESPVIESSVAQTLTDGLISTMMMHQLSRMNISITNKTIDGSVSHVVTNPGLIVDVPNIALMVEGAVRMFLSTVVPGITLNNQQTIDAYIDADIFNYTVITLSLNNGPLLTYHIPSYADSLFSSVITNPVMLQNNTQQFETLISAVNEVYDSKVSGESEIYDSSSPMYHANQGFVDHNNIPSQPLPQQFEQPEQHETFVPSNSTF